MRAHQALLHLSITFGKIGTQKNDTKKWVTAFMNDPLSIFSKKNFRGTINYKSEEQSIELEPGMFPLGW